MIALEEIRRARETIAGAAVRTPLVRLDAPAEVDAEIWLKLENLQPIRSFKIRGATNAIRRASDAEVAGGVVTASAGDMAQGVAWAARERGVPATIVVPEAAPAAKLSAIARLGGTVIKVPHAEWFQAILDSRFDGLDGLFVNPVQNDLVMAGNGTIGLEILEDLPDVDTVLVPWGGGGLSTGIASAIRQLAPEVRVCAVEPETAAPLHASLAAGEMTPAHDHRASFVDGAGAPALLPKMWEVSRGLIEESFTSSADETAAALRLLVERASVVAEGAGALSTAVALSGRAGGGKIVCVVSGGNIDASRLTAILSGETPGA